MSKELINALIALVFTGIIGGIIKIYFDYKSKQMENIWQKRLEAYVQFTKLTSLFPLYPPKTVIWSEVHKLILAFRDWYFEGNGLFVSNEFRNTYFDLQKHLLKLTEGKADSKTELIASEYKDLRERCSALRSIMARELESRESPVWYKFKKKQQV